MEDVVWVGFSQCVNIPESEIGKIGRQYGSVRECKHAVIPHLVSTHPCLSWTIVAHALYKLATSLTLSSLSSLSYDAAAVSCHSSLRLLQQRFPTGNTYCIQEQYGPTPQEAFPRVGVGAYRMSMCSCPLRDIFPAGAGALAILVLVQVPIPDV